MKLQHVINRHKLPSMHLWLKISKKNLVVVIPAIVLFGDLIQKFMVKKLITF